MTEKTFKVPDMSCSHCKAAVEERLNSLPGVGRANADVARGTVEVSYDEGKVGAEGLESAIEAAGYAVAA